MEKLEGKSREEIIGILYIYSRIDNDQKVREEAEAYHKKYGTLTAIELQRTTTI